MAYSFLVFDFSGSEDVAQQARHKVDAWKQGFRLGKKLDLKFDRKEPEAKAAAESPKAAKEDAKTKGKPKTASKSGDKAAQKSEAGVESPLEIRFLVRLDFSDHEKLSNQRWLERIPGEEPFKSAKSRIIRAGDPEFKKISDLFESLN